MSKIKVLSIGGSIIAPAGGFDIVFLKKLRKLIITRVEEGDRFILTIGGGSTARIYQQGAKKVDGDLSNDDLDWLGIQATKFNAFFVKTLFGDLCYSEVIDNPTEKIKTNKPIMVAGGWKPGCSTDRDAVLLAKTYGAKEVVNASNIDYVYTADPKKDPSAKPIKEMTWEQLKKLVGDKWVAGANVPFDPLAAKEAHKFGLRVIFIDGGKLNEFKKVLEGKKPKGTIVE